MGEWTYDDIVFGLNPGTHIKNYLVGKKEANIQNSNKKKS
jgi:hypothetical protein